MVNVTFEIKINNKVKKSFTGHLVDFFFFAMRVIGNEKFFKVGLRYVHS